MVRTAKSFPQPLETMSRNADIMGRLLRIAVAEVILHRSQIGALVGKIIAAGTPEHMGQTLPSLAFSRPRHSVIDDLASERCPRSARVDHRCGRRSSA
jgi:hypothetical protein